tara:strand:+ start:1836 stop:2570 length:735 start_codon:yes stop_codon:yes gene_type:complete
MTHGVFILHGLFGAPENLNAFIRHLNLTEKPLTPSIRNHRGGEQKASMAYTDMANDIRELFYRETLHSCDIIGHSMGGKTAMAAALLNQIPIQKLVILDIAPKVYPLYHMPIIDALLSMPLNRLKSKSDAIRLLEPKVPNLTLRQFLVKNLIKEDGQFKWGIHLNEIRNNYSNISGFPINLLTQNSHCKALCISGSQSNYVQDTDKNHMLQLFPNISFESLPTSHWIHSESPKEVAGIINQFLC